MDSSASPGAFGRAEGVESVRARVSVLAPLDMGFERATLIFTESRVIVADVGKRSSRYLLWPEGRVLGRVFGSRSESRKRQLIESSRPDEILAGDSSSFAIPFSEIVSVSLYAAGSQGEKEITVLTRRDKLVFRLVSEAPPEGFEDELRNLLGDRFSSAHSIGR